MVFSANPGRSGSGFLATLLGACHGVDAGHERLPAMVDAWLRRVSYHGADESIVDRRIKVEAIRVELELLSDDEVYVDSSHMFVKTFGDVVLDAFDHDLISVVVLRRNPIAVARSLFELGEFGIQRRPWHDFMPVPTAPGMVFRLDRSQIEDRFDLIFGCLVDNVARTRRLRERSPDVTWIDAELEVCTTVAGAQQLVAALGLEPPDEIADLVTRRVNVKATEKGLAAETVSDEHIELRLHRFVERFRDRVEVLDFAEHYGVETMS